MPLYALSALIISIALVVAVVGGRAVKQGAHITRTVTRLTSTRASLCGQFSVPMRECYGPVEMLWIRPPALTVSFLIGISPLKEVA